MLDMVDRMAEELSASVGVAGNIDVRVVAVAVAVGFEVADMMVVDAGEVVAGKVLELEIEGDDQVVGTEIEVEADVGDLCVVEGYA